MTDPARFEHGDRVLAWEQGSWYVEYEDEATLVQHPYRDLAWLMEAPWEDLVKGIWSQVGNFPFADIAVGGLRDPAKAPRTALWIEEALHHHEGRNLMTWAVTQELGEAAHDPDLDESTRKVVQGLYDYIVHPKVGRMSKEDMKEFVLGVVYGQIYTSAHCRQESTLPMVFMPLALGAFATPSYALPPEPEKPVPPDKPERPPYPEKPEKGEPPEKPEELEVETEEIERLEFEIRWHRKQPDAVEKYKASVAEQNDLLRKQHKEALEAWEAAHEAKLDAWTTQCQAVDLEYQEALKEHEEILTHWDDNHDEELALHAEWKKLREEQSKAYLSQIGVLWEWMDKAGPSSINGQPIFFSMRIMHIKDWKKCWKAIEKETQRRKEMGDLFDDEEDEDSEVPTP